MTDSRSARTDATGATDDVQQLQDRIKQLEQQLSARTASAPPARSERSGNPAMKIVAVVLGALTVVMALPAFITLRRWWDWWR